MPGEPGRAMAVLARLWGGGLLSMMVMMFSVPLYLSDFLNPGEAAGSAGHLIAVFRHVSAFVAGIAMIILGVPVLVSAARSLAARSPSVDALIALGSFTAYGLSLYATVRRHGHVYYETATMLLFFVTLGRYLEAKAKLRASAALVRWMDLDPREVTVLRDGVPERVSAESVRPGDRVRVLPGEGFPVDGVVLEGEGGVNESMLTGESRPVFKAPGQPVYAGTVSVDGAFDVAAAGVGQERVVSRLARLLDEVRASRAPIQRLADRAAAALMPVVVIVAVAAFFYWQGRAGFEYALMTALSVAVITCPCALGIATPMALWIGVGEAARRGVLIRTGEALERLAGVRHVFLDKTGTLTAGVSRLVAFRVDPSLAGLEDEVLRWAAALEALSEHPVARGLVAYARKRRTAALPAVDSFRTYPGLGVAGRVGEPESPLLTIGSRRCMERAGLSLGKPLEGEATDWEEAGRTVVFFGWGGRVRALFGFAEAVREEAGDALRRLSELGVGVTVLTGDGLGPTLALRECLPVDDLRWGLLPEDKVRAVRDRRGTGDKRSAGSGRGARPRRGAVAMVGDGINDAPALAAADVGMALGCGTDLAREAADVNFLGSNLSMVPWVLEHARRVRRVVIGNLFWAVTYNVACIGLAAAGMVKPLWAALAMVISSLFVVGNSLRLQEKAAKEPGTARAVGDAAECRAG